MAEIVSLKKFIRETPEVEKVKQKLAGLPSDWNLLNWENNLSAFLNSKDVLDTTIRTTLSEFSKSLQSLEDDINELKKISPSGFEGSFSANLYNKTKSIITSLGEVITLLSLWNDAQSDILNKLAQLLKEGKKYSYLKTKADVELESLKQLTTTMKDAVNSIPQFVSTVQKMLAEIRSQEIQDYAQVMKKVMEVGGITDLTPIYNRLDEVEERLDGIEEKVQKISIEKTKPPTFLRQTVQQPTQDIFTAMVDLIKSGVTDATEATEILKAQGFTNITPMSLAVRGWRKLVERYAPREDLNTKNEKIENTENKIVEGEDNEEG